MRKAVQVWDGDGVERDGRRMFIIAGFIDKRFKDESITAQGWGCVSHWEDERAELIKDLRLMFKEAIPGEPEDLVRVMAKLFNQIDDLLLNRRRNTIRVHGDGNHDVFVRVGFND